MSKYTDSVNHYLKGIDAFSVGACHACDTCNPDEADEDSFDRDTADEGGFSSAGCDSCGMTFGADLYPAHGLIDNNLHHFEVCGDCLMFHANGDEPEQWQQYPGTGCDCPEHDGAA